MKEKEVNNMQAIKKFFSITENKYQFEIFDILSILTVLNVALILVGWTLAPAIGIINCIISIIVNIKSKAHINTYIMQVALIILNIYFLIAFT